MTRDLPFLYDPLRKLFDYLTKVFPEDKEILPPHITTKIHKAIPLSDETQAFFTLLLGMSPMRFECLEDTHIDSVHNIPNIMDKDLRVTMKRSKDGTAMVPDEIFLSPKINGAVIFFQATCCRLDAVNAAVITRDDYGQFKIHTVPSLTGRVISTIDGVGAWRVFDTARVTVMPAQTAQIPQEQRPSMTLRGICA